jgi:hypothetical protein
MKNRTSMKPQDIIDICDKILPGASLNRKLGKCPSCQNKIDEREFRARIDLEEYRISGLCQLCQDKVFK